MKPASRTSLAAVLFAVAVLISACGSSAVEATRTKTDGDSTSTTTAVESDDDDSPSTTDSKDAPATTKNDEKGKKNGSRSNSKFCSVIGEMSDFLDDSNIDLDLSETDPQKLLDQFRDAMKKSVESFKKISKDAPAELRDEFKMFSEYLDNMTAGLNDASSLDELDAFMDQSMSEEMTEEFEAASERIEKYVLDKCGIDLNEGTN